MKTGRKILVAFILNLGFAVFELVGGLWTGSVAILSDAVHDLADAVSIGLSYGLERFSKKQPDEKYTYGYGRFSALGGFLTTAILLVGSVAVIINAVRRLFYPAPIHYDGMIVFAVVGVAVNLLAAYMTRGGETINQKAVNLHMLEDVLGWVVVLAGAVIMRFTDLAFIDPIMSIGVALFIFINALHNLKEVLALFLQKVPEHVSVEQLHYAVSHVDGVQDVHHIHLWSMDGNILSATMHIVTGNDPYKTKLAVRAALKELGIDHTVLEVEQEGEACQETSCVIHCCNHDHHAHHHHHH